MRNDDTLTALKKLQRQVPEPQEAFGLLMLAGNGFAELLVGLRARQARLEAVRAVARGSAVREARLAEALATGAALATVRSEVRRLRLKEPAATDGSTGVYGYVLKEGDPVDGAVVALIDGDDELATIETDERGAFALSVKTGRPLALRVTLGSKVVHRDEDATITPARVALYRVVDLAEANPASPTQKTHVKEPSPGTGRFDHLVGKTLTSALKEMPVSVFEVRLVKSQDSTPTIREVVDLDDGVQLEVAGSVTDVGRLAVLASLVAHQPGNDLLDVSSATAMTRLLHAGGVMTIEDATLVARQPDEEVARRFDLAPDQATGLRQALEANLPIVHVVE